MATKPHNESIDKLMDEILSTADEVGATDPKKSSKLLWKLYRAFRAHKVDNILDPRLDDIEADLFCTLANIEGMDRLLGKKMDAIKEFLRESPLLNEKYLNSNVKPELPRPMLN